ncbi:hypothetical protein BDP27DRAFT_1367888 [Rhodocollybia butyracea]|uniref:Uncharacterized protein n=1 Tax=Rhodocollybia butyracea TaxID=206335 RepID=A0A9P5PKB9_9AGAR|nr:hypothetical protein BDP27DRAFT_1367888 [Rhodocollybia butyracea]
MGDVVCLLLLCLSVMQQLLKQERRMKVQILRVSGLDFSIQVATQSPYTFGNTLTKLRNQLGVQTMTSLAEVKMHVQDEHLEIETGRCTRRRFGNALPSSQLVAISQSLIWEQAAPHLQKPKKHRDTWVSAYNTSAIHSLEEEMEFYELVDADKEGLWGVDIAVDDTARKWARVLTACNFCGSAA